MCTAAVVIVWTTIFIALLFLVLKLINLLKVSKDEELRGMKIRVYVFHKFYPQL